MTRMPLVLVLFVIICFACTSQVWAVPTVDVDGRRLETVVQPLIQNGRVFVPARSIIEAVGLSVLTFTVSISNWIGTTKLTP